MSVATPKAFRATLLCPGPSLPRDLQPASDAVVCVNRAAFWYPATHWVCLDWINAEPAGGVKHWAADVVGNPTLLIGTEGANSLQRHGIPWRGETVAVESFWREYDTRTGWTIFSAPTALVFAAHLGATEIDVFGVDMEGTKDADGADGSPLREERWRQQREIWDGTVAMLAARGVKVNRITGNNDAHAPATA